MNEIRKEMFMVFPRKLKTELNWAEDRHAVLILKTNIMCEDDSLIKTTKHLP